MRSSPGSMPDPIAGATCQWLLATRSSADAFPFAAADHAGARQVAEVRAGKRLRRLLRRALLLLLLRPLLLRLPLLRLLLLRLLLLRLL